MGLLMGAAFLPGVERESDSVQQGWSFFITVAREVGGDPIRKKVKHCVNIISTLFLLLLLLFLPSPLLTAAVQGKGIVSIISVIREREKEGGGKDPFFSWREILLLPTTLNLLFIIRGIIKRREGRNRLGLIRPCNDRSIDLLISPSDDEENSTPYPVYTQGRGWVRLRGEEGNRFWTRNWILLLVWPRNAKFLWSKEFSRSLLLLLFFPLTLDPAHGLPHPLLSPR